MKLPNKLQQNIFFLFLITLFAKFNKSEKRLSQLPKIINNYHLVKEFEEKDLVKPHRIGLYKTSQGEKAVVKFWTGNSKSFSYFSLFHEIEVYKLIEKIRTKIKTFEKNNTIAIPQLISYKLTDTLLMLMISFHEGELLDKKSVEIQLNAYNTARNYLLHITSHLSIQKTQLPKRTFIDYLVLYPVLLFIALIRQPKNTFTLLQGIPVVLLALSRITHKKLTLVHRDLHTKNMLIDEKGKITILDLQRIVLTYDLYEVVTTLAVEWNNKDFRMKLLDSIKTDETIDKRVFKGLMINFATHALTANNLPERYMTKYNDMLTYSTYKL